VSSLRQGLSSALGSLRKVDVHLQATQKKKFRMLSVQSGLRGNNDLSVGRKMATIQLFFQSREQVLVRRGQIRRIERLIKKLEAQWASFF
jgi:hypothetical protein